LISGNVAVHLAILHQIIRNVEADRLSEMALPVVEFDPSRAARYEKTTEVLAFRSDDQFIFLKPWGRQELPAGSWILVPLRDGIPTGDLYGCHPEAFASTYIPARSGNAHTYEKCGHIEAYQPGTPFAVQTIISGYVETDPAIGGAEDWLVRNPGGEVYVIADAVFRNTYRPADCACDLQNELGSEEGQHQCANLSD
jgi:hypothetical protein